MVGYDWMDASRGTKKKQQEQSKQGKKRNKKGIYLMRVLNTNIETRVLVGSYGQVDICLGSNKRHLQPFPRLAFVNHELFRFLQNNGMNRLLIYGFPPLPTSRNKALAADHKR